MIRISLSETARRHGIDKGQLSRDVHAGKETSRGYPICRFAVRGIDKRITGFDFPEGYAFPGLRNVRFWSKPIGVAAVTLICSVGLGILLSRK